ncbi:hypothetical protein [Ethanoligenens harbinense]|uniref:Uncharacterized protein n=1 Tax=Ethanoligenens harbinense (strain DSM 18485 / JCM 12961 / CGMCC 1.5033 / YUAN-3) TaxID=663278 RepID=E6U5X0_ETHHY|nr:hypothetical protein [Ethanoligenens harbinense]ADU27987.1 hypothetical protein Ethha_2494 [Ethanoligenens harbinense YUAN-3]AVQ97011.1 hypothetical protein CXQ68_12790 [Ethanoligenens harbinense YUAN-3]AYF39672.1 hypothetical protein CXP51_12690 [Ethanoligenens harbinense]AYF42503.1 hypothetical protein CN246_13260 [Ethanoligenens harbinense]QCN93253.1 hypothetical protein DRA42_12835 [Ethanoligenens harbinense]
MFQLIAGITIAFFTVIGITEVFRCGLRYLLTPPEDRVTYVVRVHGRDEGVEYIVRALAFAAREQCARNVPVIILIDDDMDTQTRQICDVLAGELGCVRVCKSQEIPRVINAEA